MRQSFAFDKVSHTASGASIRLIEFGGPNTFGDKKPTKSSRNQICRSLGISKPTLYAYVRQAEG